MPTQKTYTISGRITDRSGAPLAGLTVRATDLDPHTPENVLGKPVQTGADGRYTIRYTDADFRLPKESGGADIVIRVYDPSGNLLGQSELHRNAGANVMIDVQVEYALPEAPEENGETRVFEFARIINLPRDKAELLAARKINLHEANAATLESLVQENILTQKQKTELGLAIDLSRLGGENYELIRALKNDRLTSVSEFVDWEKSDWEKALRDNRITVPKEETSLEAYAENLRNNIEKSFPTPYLLKRLIKKDYQPDMENPTAFANTYRHLGVQNILNNQQLNPRDKKTAISKRLGALDTFYRNNPDLDFESANFVEAENAWNWSGIEASERKLVKSQMMAYQRTLELTNDYQSCRKLLEKGYDSALAIARMPEVKFLKETGLGKTQGRKIYTSAQQKASGAILALAAMQDLNKGLFGSTNVSNLGNITNVLREWDGYEALFGAQQFCDCEHCRSIFGPAAYFVDLMHFVEEQVSEEGFIKPGHTNHPLYLKNRRPDLWRLQLTCANTNTEIPYLTVVNEVLEQYLEHEQGTSDIYRKLEKATVSMGLPFNLPLEEVRLFLSHFGLSLGDVYDALGVPWVQNAKERMHISSESELQLITHKDVGTARAVFGNEKLKDFEVNKFLEYAGISRENLDDLLRVTAISGINQVRVLRIKKEDDIQQYREVLVDLTEERLDCIHRFLRLWKKTPWTIRELDLFLNQCHLNDLGAIDDGGNPHILRLADWITMQEKLRLTAEELAALIGNIPRTPVRENQRSLYERLFDLEKIFGTGETTTLPSNKSADTIRPLLSAGLGIEEAELEALFQFSGINTGADQKLNHERISVLYRQVRTAKGLGMTIEDFINACKLVLGGLPVQGAGSVEAVFDYKELNGPDNPPGELSIEALLDFKEWLKTSPFTVSDLLFILKGEESKKRHFEYDGTSVAAAVWKMKISTTTKESEKIVLLKSYLQGLFNLTQEQLEQDFLAKQIGADIHSAEIITALNTSFDAEGQPPTPNNLNALVALVRQLERRVRLFRLLDFDAPTIRYFLENEALFGVKDLKALTHADIRHAVYYRILVKENAAFGQKIQQVLNMYQSASGFTDEAIAILAEVWQEPAAQIKSVVTESGLAFPSVAVEALRYLRELLGLANKLGIGGASLARLGAGDYKGLQAAREVAFAAFSTKYADEKTRQEKLAPFMDRINERKRDALCDYITAQRDKYKFKDRSDLFQFFLLDVEMSGCFRTSRVVAAITSLQLYVHRCLLNLEQSDKTLNPNFVEIKVNPTWIPAAEWEWRKNYRVWEANRKVFLYPENYIDPTLRKGKTPLFKELEDELLQENITQESAEAAYKKYMAQFVELADLRYAGAYYHEIDCDFVELPNSHHYVLSSQPRVPEDRVYYLFARTNKQPYQYYYRTYIEQPTQWGNWQKIDLAIEADEVSVLMYQGKLFLFWTEVQQKELTKTEKGSSKSDGTIFKIYVKYAFLNENGRWSSPQRLYIGFTHLEEEMVYRRLGIYPKFDKSNKVEKNLAEKELEQKHDFVFEKFVKTVFRKPYARISDNFGSPIQLAYIWSQFKGFNITEFSTAFQTQAAGGYAFLLPSTTFFTINRIAYPAQKSVNCKFRKKNTSDNWETCEAVFKLEIPADGTKEPEVLVKILNPKIEFRIIATTQASSDEGTFSSMYDLALTAQRIENISNADISVTTDNFQLITPGESYYLHKEYEKAYQDENIFNHYVENGSEKFTSFPGKTIVQNESIDAYLSDSNGSTIEVVRLSTILTDELSKILSQKGLTEFLKLTSQQLTEHGRDLDFSGPYGNYYWELFFHIPFLIANHLNANQKFKEAKWWYERIFNPTSEEKPADQPPSDHNWQFREFRGQHIEKLKEILTNDVAIAAYRKDPFDPHAIAALRMNAYQKAIVMKYIDNLLDWGDHLFAQDTRESINEAEMLYQLAADILGDRPAKMGKCDMASENAITYEKVGPEIEEDSEFLITLENWQVGLQWEYKSDIEPYRVYKDGLASLRNGKDPESRASLAEVANLAAAKGFREYRRLSKSDDEGIAGKPATPQTSRETVAELVPTRHISDYSNKRKADNYLREQESSLNKWKDDPTSIKDRIVNDSILREPNDFLTRQSYLAFCVPYNTDFLAYWDRVQDRLWKIRWCMNLQGVRRSLALFQPPIDPMLLVRAKAAGLNWENLQTFDLVSSYRFSFLIEKARQFAQTVQSLGSALLSVLEKRDGEELALLRSVHEQNVLKMTKKIKKSTIEEAKSNFRALEETMVNVQNRIEYYQLLIDNGLIEWEKVQQTSQHVATLYKLDASIFYLESSFLYLLSQLGSFFAITFGGKQLGHSVEDLAKWDSEFAAIAESISRSASMEATFQRREQEWNQQLKLAQQEKKQVEQQILAAEMRVQIAERDLEVHEKNIEQSEEVYAFYKDKFTNLGLYQFMAKELLRLYREAYQMAYNMARLAESAYRFETDDDTLLISGDNWSADKSGLLAGEKLLLQLQQLEQSYLEKNVRRPEITQSFSLAMIDPSELIKLRQSGSCAFKIPQIAFEMFYPGQYKRLIKSVRLSMPCIVGPYTNVSARLSLTKGEVEIESGGKLENWDYGKNTSLYASSAANDAGMFDFNFRDERYLPFEGAGAISEWQLDLPSQIRAFNYDTISDVILHISYTAREGDREEAENKLAATLTSYAQEIGMFKLISLKNQFPQPFQLLNPPERVAPSASFATESGHFPYFLNKENLSLNELTIYLKPKKGMSVVPPADFKVNGEVIEWKSVDDLALSGTTGENDKIKGGQKVTVSGSPVGNWTIEVSPGGLNPEELDDLLILMKYQVV